MGHSQLRIPARDLRVGDVFVGGGTITRVDTSTAWGVVLAEVDYAVQRQFNHGDRVEVTREVEDIPSSVFTLEIALDNAAFGGGEGEFTRDLVIAAVLRDTAKLIREGRPYEVIRDENGNTVGHARIERQTTFHEDGLDLLDA